MTPTWHSRDELPRILNELGLLGHGVEVGSQRGLFARHIRKEWRGEHLTCVDPWAPHDGYAETKEQHEECLGEFMRNMGSLGMPGTWSCLRKGSIQGAFDVARYAKRLDFVYIDAAHDYRSVRADIMAWLPLVRSGGILAGHDWILDGWLVDGNPFVAFASREEALAAAGRSQVHEFGVRAAVADVLGLLDGYSLSVTSPAKDGGYQSWLVVKP